MEEANPQLIKNVQKAKFDVAYLLDIYDKFNAKAVYSYLRQIQREGSVLSFLQDSYLLPFGKLTLFKLNIDRREFYQFPRLAELAVSEDDLLVYCDHLDALKMDMIKRFTDLLELEISDWVGNPFCANVVSLCLQEELIDF